MEKALWGPCRLVPSINASNCDIHVLIIHYCGAGSVLDKKTTIYAHYARGTKVFRIKFSWRQLCRRKSRYCQHEESWNGSGNFKFRLWNFALSVMQASIWRCCIARAFHIMKCDEFAETKYFHSRSQLSNKPWPTRSKLLCAALVGSVCSDQSAQLSRCLRKQCTWICLI